MLAPILQDHSSNLEWMNRSRPLGDTVAQGGGAAESDQAYSAKVDSPSAVAAGAESSQSRSSTEKSAYPNEPEKEAAKEAAKESEQNEKSGELTTAEQRVVSQMQTTDRAVRAHEQAHLSAAQGIAVSGANYQYRVGPDDKRYAVAGEVSIDTSKESEPEQTIAKGNSIIQAALAPADPSAQDHAVAARAAQMIQEAQAELMRRSYAQNQESNEEEASEVGDTVDEEA